MNSNYLLIAIIPATLFYVWMSRNGRRSALMARSYMLVVYAISGLSALGVISLDGDTRVLLLRLGWLSLVTEEIITYFKIRYWSRKAAKANGTM